MKNKNIFKVEFKISNLDTSIDKTFSPIRILLKDNKSYNNILLNVFNIERKNENWTLLETLFSWNEIFPLGLNWSLGLELGKTIAFLDTFQINISFIVSGMKNCKEKDILEDIRISMQNFIYFIVIGSFYSAFGEYRKIIEGAIWINALKNKKEIKDSRIDYEESYSKQLNDYKNMKEYYKYSSNVLIHTKEPIYLNWTTKSENNITNKLQTLIQNCYSEMREVYDSIFQIDWIQNNEVIKKYSRLYFEIEKLRSSYNLIDHPIAYEDYETEIQKYFYKRMNFFNALTIKERKKMINDYKNDLSYLSNNAFERYYNIVRTNDEKLYPLKNIRMINIAKKFNNKYFLEIITFISNLNIFKNKLELDELKKKINLRYTSHRDEINQLMDIAISLFSLEININYKFIRQTRLVIEDLIFNTLYGKLFNMSINILFSLLEKKIEIPKNISKNKHIIFKDRILYVDNEGKKTGKENNEEIIKDTIKYLFKYINILKKEKNYSIFKK